MKKFIYSFVLFCGVLALVLSGCKGEDGPAGPAGPAGTNGTDGTNGVDGNAVCLLCHNLATKALVETMYNSSQHAAGDYVGYAGSRQGCAYCHSDQGFREMQYTGADTLMGDIVAPQPIQCVTCHDFHATLDFDADGPDYALRATEPVDLIAWRGTKDITLDMGGNGNLCANCHQPRRLPPVPGSADSFNITSSHWGPHHGPQATILEGIGGYEVAGSESYPTTPTTHRTGADCTTCHMHSEDGNTSEGGHTWWPILASCLPCHTDATDFDINGVQSKIIVLLDDLEAKLFAAGVIDVDGHVVKGTYPIDVAGAFWNWVSIGAEDKSFGVHNYPYANALLVNSIESIN